MTNPNQSNRRKPFFIRPVQPLNEALWRRAENDLRRFTPPKDYFQRERARLSALGIIGPSPTNRDQPEASNNG